MGYMDEYKFWLESDCFDEKTKEELRSIADDDKEIQDRFYKNLKFGTGGMRGIMGAGTNRMNIYTVTKATQGLAEYILEVGPEAAKRGVVIAHDCRNMSAEFTEASALCLNANGIKTYVFDALRPTPELSFAVRELGCIAGIVVTASHNPPEYNGYKVYWEDGSQIVSPQDQDILKHVANVERYEDVKTMDKDKAIADGLFCMVPTSVDENYYQALIKQTIHGDIIPKVADDIKIVYTPLHGTGNVPVREVLKRLGFKHVYVVEEQTVPDGDFSTVKSPNPEEPSAFAMGIDLAKKVDADVIMATDPDADRLGIYVKDSTGIWKDTEFADDPAYPYVRFNANMTGALIAEYVCREQKAVGKLPANGAICNTVVSTNLTKAIAENYIHSGIMPAVNPGISVSRVGGDAQIKAMKKVAGRLKLLYSQYRELQSFAQFGSDLDRDTQERLAQGERIVEVLKQDRNAPVDVAHQVAILYAVIGGYLKDVPVAKIRAFETELYPWMDANYAGLLENIRTTGKLSDEDEAALKTAIETRVAEFLRNL